MLQSQMTPVSDVSSVMQTHRCRRDIKERSRSITNRCQNCPGALLLGRETVYPGLTSLYLHGCMQPLSNGAKDQGSRPWFLVFGVV
ncbi:hypothetical protein POX_f08253 [Penicillium oxalicum]|uniref:hypothetical protein n=1 Tax=Penicillium oxalicum TaxID=69781 RepID=UPI0020B8A306|nr:hypothetical protein POX_f08253 [Penicillium oxalicum]KAI2787872.1 hypothetical protein POX_f08253 [Penicillium oxalicum]